MIYGLFELYYKNPKKPYSDYQAPFFTVPLPVLCVLLVSLVFLSSRCFCSLFWVFPQMFKLGMWRGDVKMPTVTPDVCTHKSDP